MTFLIAEAYSFMTGLIVPAETGANPETLAHLREGYDVVAKAEHPVSKAALRLMLHSLLAGRFALALHREMKMERVYKLVIAKGGLKLESSQGGGDILMEAGPGGLPSATRRFIGWPVIFRTFSTELSQRVQAVSTTSW